MSYEIVKAAPEIPASRGNRVKTTEREAMEQLAVGDAFWIADAAKVRAARDARYKLAPKQFTVRKDESRERRGWQVRRVE